MDIEAEDIPTSPAEHVDYYNQLPRYSLTGGKLCPELLSIEHLPEDRLAILTKFSKSCPRRRFENQVDVEVQRITEQLTRRVERRNPRLRYDPCHSIKCNAEINVKTRWDERGIWNHNWPDFKPGLLWGHEGVPADFDFGPNVYLQTFDEEYIGDQYLTRKTFPQTIYRYCRWSCIPYSDNYKLGQRSSPHYLLELSLPHAQFFDEIQEEIRWFYGEPQILVDQDTYSSFINMDRPLSITTRRFRGISTVDRFGQVLPVNENGSQRVVDIFGYEADLHGTELRIHDDFYGGISPRQIEKENELVWYTLRKRWQAEEIWDSNWNMFPKSYRSRWLHETVKPEELRAILAGDIGHNE